MTAGAKTAPDHLLNSAHVPPRIQDMGLPDTAEVHTLCNQRTGDDDPDLGSIAIAFTPRLTDELRNRLLRPRGRQERIRALRRTLVGWVGKKRRPRDRSIAMLFQRHRKEFSAHLDVIRIDEDDPLSGFDALDHAGKLRRVLCEGRRSQERLARVCELRAPERERSCKVDVVRQNRNGRHHEETALLIVILTLLLLKDRGLKSGGLTLNERQHLKSPRIALSRPGGLKLRCRRRRRRQTKGKREWTVTLDVRDVVLAQAFEQVTLALLEVGVGIKEVGGHQSPRRILRTTIVPEEEVEIEQDLIEGLVHRRRRQEHQNEAVRILHELLNGGRDRLLRPDVRLRANVVGLVDDQETVAVGLANPGFEGLAVSAQLALHFVDLVAEGRIRREVIELGDHAVRNLL